MKVIRSVNEMTAFSLEKHGEGQKVGFVPTMGYLHEGHLSLVRASLRECDVTVVSIFVNPSQFGPAEDLDKYPRDVDNDKNTLDGCGVDAVFLPDDKEMYPAGNCTSAKVSGALTEVLCGASRPGHFNGVCLVLTKLFNVVNPDASYFGQKDAQQTIVVKRLVKDLNFRTEVRVMPIVRESDGLALSSRNIYLSTEERKAALSIYASLKKAEGSFCEGQRSSLILKNEVERVVSKDIELDYLEVMNAGDLKRIDIIEGKALVAIAAYVGKTRLIDNILLDAAAKA